MSSADQSNVATKRECDTTTENPSKRPRGHGNQSTTNKPNFKKSGDGRNAKFQTKKGKWQKKDTQYHYGNYDRYYGKRAVHDGHGKDSKDGDANSSDFNDHRLKQFKCEWFDEKKVLDIGCNVGFMTMAIAHRFGPSSIVGLDIDGNLIQTAKNILRKKFGPADSQSGKKQGGWESLQDDLDQLTEREKANVFKRVRFETGNYVLSEDSLLDFVQPEYDVILALSLTKWIHLNWGDDGMKRFFRRIYRHLNPGGILLLEPQPWSTYKKRRALTPEIAEHYNNIQFKPDRFRPFLMSEDIGFESYEVINKVECEEGKGFHRPIYLFRKPTVEGKSAKEDGETSGTKDHDDGDKETT